MWSTRILCLSLALLTARDARAGEREGPLQEGKRLYRQIEFERCIQVLEDAERHLTAAAEWVDREIYLGLCNAALNRTRQASRHFQAALELDPAATLPPNSSPKVESLFQLAQARAATTVGSSRTVPMPAPQAPPWDFAPSLPARAPVSPPVARKLAWLPWVLAGAGIAGVGGFAGFGVAARSTASTANAPQTYPDVSAQLGSAAQQQATLANVSLAVGIVAMGGAITTWVLTRGTEGSAQ
jgi:hypothetical protein